MTIKEIIDGLKFTVDMFLFNPSTGETYTEPRNDIDKTTIDACKGAIALLEQTRWNPISEGLPKETGWYYVSFKTYHGEIEACELCYRKPENYWTGHDIRIKALDNKDIVAWMPLPEPYEP